MQGADPSPPDTAPLLTVRRRALGLSAGKELDCATGCAAADCCVVDSEVAMVILFLRLAAVRRLTVFQHRQAPLWVVRNRKRYRPIANITLGPRRRNIDRLCVCIEMRGRLASDLVDGRVSSGNQSSSAAADTDFGSAGRTLLRRDDASR
jgi:hypothetical protein